MMNASPALFLRELAKAVLFLLLAPFAIVIFLSVILPLLLVMMLVSLFFTSGRLRNAFINFHSSSLRQKRDPGVPNAVNGSFGGTPPSGTAPRGGGIDVECKVLDSVEIGPDGGEKTND